MVQKTFAVVCLSSNINAHVALQVIKLITKQKVKTMGKMLTIQHLEFAAIAVNYGIIHRAFYRYGHRTSLALEKTGSVVMHDIIYIYLIIMYLPLTYRLLQKYRK